MEFETRAVHGGEEKNKDKFFGSTIDMASAFPIKKFGKSQDFVYSRSNSPTKQDLEKLMANLENGKYAYVFSSGMGATNAVLTLFQSGDHVIVGADVYGGTYRIIKELYPKFGIDYTFVDTTELKNIEDAIKENTKAILVETPSNPLMDVTDIRGTVDIAKKHGIITVVDNTFLTPYLQKPLDLGADIVIHSATKFLSGHHDIIAGVVVTNDEEIGAKIKFAMRTAGGIMSPFDSWLLIRSLKTLKVRMDAAQKNTEQLVEFFQNHPAVKEVLYPTADNNKGKKIQESQASGGGAVFSFRLKDDSKVASFFNNLKIATLAASLGGTETLVTHPATITHDDMPEEEREARGLTYSLIRVAPGIENIKDLIEDFKQALEK